MLIIKRFDNGSSFMTNWVQIMCLLFSFVNLIVQYKFQQVTEMKLEYYAETHNGFGLGLTGSSRRYEALLNLPGVEYYKASQGDPFNTLKQASACDSPTRNAH
jgi:hypothetical protein